MDSPEKPPRQTAPPDLQALAASVSVQDEPGGPEWRLTSAALYARLRGSQSDFRAFLQDIYPTSAAEFKVERPCAYVGWAVRQLATLYPSDPRVEYLNPETGQPYDDATQATILRYRSEAGIRAAMHAAHEEMIATGNGTVWLWPVIRKGADGKPRLDIVARSLPAHYQAIEPGKHPETGDERDVATWWYRHPLPGGRAANGAVQQFGVVRVDAKEASWESAAGGLEGMAVWPGADGTTKTEHDLGEIPVTVIRWFSPESGQMWSHAREVLLAQARAWDVAWTEGGDIATMQSAGQWIGEGMTPAEAGKIRMSTRRVVGIGAGQKLKPEAPNADMLGFTTFHEGYMRVSVAADSLNPAGLLRTTAVTAEGKDRELFDRETLRLQHVGELARAEQRIYDQHRKWLRIVTGADVLPPAIVKPHYVAPEVPREPLQELQAAVWRVALGVSDPAQEYIRIARATGMSPAEAERVVKDNLKRTKEILGYIPTPAGVAGGAADGPPAASDPVTP